MAKLMRVQDAARDEYRGYRIDLISGWTGIDDHHYFRLYLQRLDERGRAIGRRERINGTAEAITEAFDLGMAIARAEIDRRIALA